jgi:hypothetical protein
VAIPKHFDMLGRRWRVLVEPVDPDDSACFGETQPSTDTVRLYTIPHKLRPGRGSLEQTCFHEAIHAALTSSGLASMLEHGAEEAAVTTLEGLLWPVICQLSGGKLK